MMHPALLRLIALRMRSMRRRTLRGIKTPRGALFFGFGVIMFTLWLGPSLFYAFTGDGADPKQLEMYAPFAILGICLVTLISSAGERAIYFSPGEVEFLFPGPFGRRELLGYKVLGLVIGVLLSSLIFSAFILRYAASWPAAYVGVFLSLLFVQLFSMSLLLAGQTMAEGAYTRLRKLVLLALALVLAIALGPALALRSSGDFGQAVAQAQQSAVVHYALLPLAPFARTLAAERIFPDLLIWGAAALAINGGLFLFILWLDAEYRETAISVSQKMYSRIQRAQRSGMAPSASSKARGRVPQPPWLGGAGPIAWRQMTGTLRNARSLMMILIIVGLAIGFPAVARGGVEQKAWTMTLAMLIYLTIFLSMMVRFDFRADLDQMDWLKMLPIRPWALVVGQLAVPLLFCTLLQLTLVAITVQLAGHPERLLMAALFAPLFNVLLFGTENALFLLFPSRVVAFSPGDFQTFGRQLLFMLVKIVLVTLACLAAVGIGGLVYLVLGRAPLIMGVAAWIVMAAQAVAVVPIAAWAFRRFDVSLDTPT